MKRLAANLLLTLLLVGCTAPAGASVKPDPISFTRVDAVTNTSTREDPEGYDAETLALPEKLISLLAGGKSLDQGQLGDVLDSRREGQRVLAEIRRYENENWWVIYDSESGCYSWLIANAKLVSFSLDKKIVFQTGYFSEITAKLFPMVYIYTRNENRWDCVNGRSFLKFEEGTEFGFEFAGDKPFHLYDVIVVPNGIVFITDIQGNDATPYTVITTDAVRGILTVTLKDCETDLSGDISYSERISFPCVSVVENGGDTQILLNIGRNGYNVYYTAETQNGFFKTTPETGLLTTVITLSDYPAIEQHLSAEIF